MDCYQVRVDHLVENDSSKYKKLESYFDSFLRVFEEGEVTKKPHFHYYVEMSAKVPTVRRYIREHMKLKNSTYMIKRLDERYPVEYLAYMLKCVKDSEYCNKGIPDEVIDKAKVYDLSVKDSIRENKKTKLPVWMRIESDLIESGINILNQRSLVEGVVDYYRKNDLLIREFQIVSIVQTISVRNGGSQRDSFVSRICDKLI